MFLSTNSILRIERMFAGVNSRFNYPYSFPFPYKWNNKDNRFSAKPQFKVLWIVPFTIYVHVSICTSSGTSAGKSLHSEMGKNTEHIFCIGIRCDGFVLPQISQNLFWKRLLLFKPSYSVWKAAKYSRRSKQWETR